MSLWKRRERELDEELRAHFRMAVEEGIAKGQSLAEAERDARRVFGNELLVKEVTRDMWGWASAERLFQDLKYALRQMRRSPGFTAIALAVMALGIGANTAIFSVVDAVLLKPLPYADPDRLVMLWETRPDLGHDRNVVSAANYLDWRARAASFDAMSPVSDQTRGLTGLGEPEQVRVQFVGADFFPMLGVPLARGRSFTAGEVQPGAPGTAILSDALWQRKFGADPSIVGKTIRVGAAPATVIGVAPPGILTLGDRPPDLWQPLVLRYTNANGVRASGRNFWVLARMKPRITAAQADREIRAIAKQLEREYPQFDTNWSARAIPLPKDLYGKVEPALWVLLGAVILILLIACTNVANLVLTRAAGREREMAVRAALGAGRGRLVRQVLIESLTLSSCGGILGLILGYGLVALLKLIGPADVPRLDRAGLSGPVVLFTIAATILTGLALGLAPALLAARRGIGATIREGGRGSSAAKRATGLRNVFTVVQVALALMLLSGAGVLLRSLARLTAVEPGFRTDHVLTMDLSLPPSRYRNGKDVRFFDDLDRRVRVLPGVINASTITFLPFKGLGSATYFWRADQPKPAPGHEAVTDVRMVQPQYFETMNIPLRRGRTFDDRETDSQAPLRFVVNDTLAHQMFPNEDPIGQRLVVNMQAQNPPGEIIGVVGNIKPGSLTDKAKAMVYYPQAQLSFSIGTLVVHTAGDPLAMAGTVRGIVRQMDPALPISEVGTMQRWVDESLVRTRFQTGLLAIFAGLALLLATLGIYGVMSYGVAQRAHEIGVRVALGAQRWQVARTVFSRALVLTLAGLAIGFAGAEVMLRYLRTLLFETEPTDPITLTLVTALLLAVGLIAALAPAGRASKVDPVVVLRYE